MKCSRRSTTWLVSTVLAVVTATFPRIAAARAGGQPTVGEESAIRHAIEVAVKARMGQNASVRIETLRWQGTPGDDTESLTATPEPGARLGRPTRFTLVRQNHGASTPARTTATAGFAVATVEVAVGHLTAARPLVRAETLGEADALESRDEVGSVPMQRLPTLADVAGARIVRDVAQGEVLTRMVLAVQPPVQSGDEVLVRAMVDGVLAEGRGVAEQSGHSGDLIRVVNRDSRRAFKARVIGRGEVEVVR